MFKTMLVLESIAVKAEYAPVLVELTVEWGTHTSIK